MDERPSLAPPDGYEYHGELFGSMRLQLEAMGPWRSLLAGNLLALVPLAAAIALLWLPYQFYRTWGAPLAPSVELNLSLTTRILLTVTALLLSIVLHELLHGAVLTLAGHRPRLMIRFGFPIADVARGAFLTRPLYLTMALAPLAVISFAGGVALLLLPPSLGELMLPALLLNAAASVGDLLVVDRVRRAPPAALFASDQEILVFMPAQREINGCPK